MIAAALNRVLADRRLRDPASAERAGRNPRTDRLLEARAGAGRARAPAFIALLFLLLTPNYYGQMFNNPKDIPFAVGVVWATYYMVRIVPTLPRPPLAAAGQARGWRSVWRWGCGSAACCCCAISASCWRCDGTWRAVAADRLGVLVATGLDQLLARSPAGRRRRLSGHAVVLAVGADRPDRESAARPCLLLAQTFPFYTLFDGRFRAGERPALDLSPDLYRRSRCRSSFWSCCFAAPVAGGGRALARQISGSAREQALAAFVLGIGIVFPVAYAIAIKAVLFDGMRHFIFVLPLIAVAAAVVADRGSRLACRGSRTGGRSTRALALYGCAHISIMVMLHPDQYVYYNAFVGGVEGAQHKFKLDYWANSYAEAVHGLEDYLRAEYGADFEEREFTVAVCGPPISAGYYFPPNFRFVRDRARPISLSPSPRTIATDHCPAGRFIGSSAWVRCCRWCSIGARLVAERRAAKQASPASPSRPIPGSPPLHSPPSP